jgi:hypothetical protein
MNCPTCGEVVPVGTRFCANCGAEVVGENDLPPAPEVGTVVDMGPVPYLVVTAGRGRGQTFDLRGEVRLGRDRSNAIVLSDGKVSRHHIRLDPIRGTYILSDLGSANGTFVNGVRVTQPVRLREGDLINLGDTQMVFYTGAAGGRLADRSPAPEERAPAPPPPSPVSSSPAPGSFVTAPAGMPPWVWFGCAALFVLVILLVIVALLAGVFIGHGGLGVM